MSHIFRFKCSRLLSFFTFLILLFSISLNLTISIHHVSAINPIMYALNNILGYDGEEECDDSLWGDDITSSGDDSSVVGGNSGEKLRKFVKEYGELAQKLQIEYGVPWELVFGQAVAESSVGTSTNPTAPSKMAADRGHYNWLGLTYSSNGKYNIKIPEGQRIHNSHGDWNEYESLENMIKGYYIDFLRNGNYDKAFQYSTYDNFDLKKFVVGSTGDPANSQLDGIGFAYVCGPNASSCNLSNYWKNIMSGVNTAREVAAEEGWPTSEELAKEKKIGIGGKHSDLNATIDTTDNDYNSDTSTINSSDPCKQQASKYNKTNTDSIAKKALELAWPYEDGTCETSNGEKVDYKTDGKKCYTNPKPAYAEAMTKYNIPGSPMDCGHFVAAVIYSSGVDNNFPKSGTANMLPYLQKTTDIWEEIENTGDESILRPGDILIINDGVGHHIQVYVGSLSDYGNIASASQGTQVGITKNMKSDIRHSSGGKYHIFRLKHSASGGDITTIKLNGHTYAFPLAGATKSNYLNPGGNYTSALSRIPCGSGNVCHHDYAAVDMGIMYNNQTDDMKYYSTGAPVVAFTDGTITTYKPYSRATQGYQDKCASVLFKANDGYTYWLGHMSYDPQYKAGDTFKAGDIIGEVGPPQCAIGTQAHFHINIQEPYGNREVIDIIDKLWEELPD